MTLDGSQEPACNDGSPAPAAPSVVDEMDVDKSEASEDDGSLTGQFTWIIENFNKLKQPKLYSPVFQSAQYNWRILLFPGGNNVTQLSVYLDVADSATLPQGWSRQAHFTLTVHNQKDPSRSVIKGTRQLPLPAALRLLPTALPCNQGEG
jgi:ubiquitin carboxyl-terminal hydrolase 7